MKQMESRFIRYFYNGSKDHIHSVHISTYDPQLLLSIRVIFWVYLSMFYIYKQLFLNSLTLTFIWITDESIFFTWVFYNTVILDYFMNHRRKQTKVPEISPNLKYWIQALYQLSFSLSLPVTVIFWTVVYPSEISNHPQLQQDNYLVFLVINEHTIPILMLTTDLFLNSYTFYIKRLILLALYGVFYMLINLFYSKNVKIVYDPIDWQSLLSYVFLLAACTLGLLMFLIGRRIYTYKLPYLLQQQKQQQLRNIARQMNQQSSNNKTALQDEQMVVY